MTWNSTSSTRIEEGNLAVLGVFIDQGYEHVALKTAFDFWPTTWTRANHRQKAC